MSKKNSRTCCVCGKSYSFCPTCNPEDKDKPYWMFAWCSENCKEIYNVTSQYENEQLSAKEAKKQLDKLDLSRLEHYGSSYKKSIEKINSEVVSQNKKNKATVKFDPVVENTVVEEISYAESEIDSNNVEK